MKTNLPYYFHPTTVILIDDDLDAITNYGYSLPSNFSIKTFTVPEEALEYINSSEMVKPLHERCQPLVRDINFFEKEAANKNRYEECCVVVTDYAMPSMNGVELCKSIDNPHVSKILFTGIADEKLAVGAFNEKVIDRFFVKQDSKALSKLSDAVTEIQKEYFCKTSHLVNELVQYATPQFLKDRKFLDFFEELIQKNSIYEYYISHNPHGFLLANEKGELSRLLVYTKDDLDFQYQMASSHHSTEELQQLLKKDEIREIPFFWKNPFGIYDEKSTEWKQYLYPASTLVGEQTYYYSFISDPPGYETLKHDFIGFFDYVESLPSNC